MSASNRGLFSKTIDVVSTNKVADPSSLIRSKSVPSTSQPIPIPQKQMAKKVTYVLTNPLSSPMNAGLSKLREMIEAQEKLDELKIENRNTALLDDVIEADDNLTNEEDFPRPGI